MQFCPCFDQALLAFWQRTIRQLNWVNAIDRDRVLIVSMEVGASVPLAVGFPWREDDRFTTFPVRTLMEGLGSACLPVAHHLRQGMREALPLTTCLLAQAYLIQHLWLVGSNDIYQRFTCVSHTLRP